MAATAKFWALAFKILSKQEAPLHKAFLNERISEEAMEFGIRRVATRRAATTTTV